MTGTHLDVLELERSVLGCDYERLGLESHLTELRSGWGGLELVGGNPRVEGELLPRVWLGSGFLRTLLPRMSVGESCDAQSNHDNNLSSPRVQANAPIGSQGGRLRIFFPSSYMPKSLGSTNFLGTETWKTFSCRFKPVESAPSFEIGGGTHVEPIVAHDEESLLSSRELAGEEEGRRRRTLVQALGPQLFSTRQRTLFPFGSRCTAVSTAKVVSA